jgi:hypothetical protein
MEKWSQFFDLQPRPDRVSCIRELRLERTAQHEHVGQNLQPVLTGLSINLSSRGLCVLLDWQPEHGEVLRVHVPTPVVMMQVPTLADVRWIRVLAFKNHSFVIAGLKFLV